MKWKSAVAALQRDFISGLPVEPFLFQNSKLLKNHLLKPVVKDFLF
jgi:hypothetical protein